MSIPTFIMGFSTCSIVIALYLLYQLIEILRELVEIVKEELKDD